MHKRLTFIEMFATTLFAMTLQDNVDMVLDLKLDWYGYFDKGVQWETYIVIFGIYPAITLIFLNYYPNDKAIRKIIYVLAWSIFAVVYEWAAMQSGYFYHNQWKLWYSAISYPILFWVLALVLQLVRQAVKKVTSP